MARKNDWFAMVANIDALKREGFISAREAKSLQKRKEKALEEFFGPKEENKIVR